MAANITERKEFRDLPVKMTEEERLERSQKMIDAMTLVKGYKAQIDATKEQLKGPIEESQAEADRMYRELHGGTIDKEVECIMQYRWDEKTKVLIRTDTGEEVCKEGISEQDIQTNAFDAQHMG